MQAASCIRCGHPLLESHHWQCQDAQCENTGVHSCRKCGKLVCGKHAVFAGFRAQCQSCYPKRVHILEERGTEVGIFICLALLAAEVGAYPSIVNALASYLLSHGMHPPLTLTEAVSAAVCGAVFLGGLFVMCILAGILRLAMMSPSSSERM